jgi:hypothetical protein
MTRLIAIVRACWPVIAFVVVIAALLLWLSAHDRALVRADRAEADAQASGLVLGADRSAGGAKAERDRADAVTQTQLQEEADAAASAGASPLDALFGELR